MLSVFAYGTLQFEEVMTAVTGSPHRGIPAVLEGYRRFRLKAHTYPGIVRAPESFTPGLLYPGLDRTTLRVLDSFEDDIYRRRTVVVRAADGSDYPAETYVIPGCYASALTAEPWDPAAFDRDHLSRFVRGCETFRRQYGR